MRVLIIGLFAPDYMIAFANALAKQCEVALMLTRQNICGLFPDEPNPTEKLQTMGILDPGIDLQVIDYPKRSFFYKAGFVLRLLRQVRHFRPDVLHYHSGGDPWVPMALPFLRDFPLVVSIHDASHHPGDKPPKVILNLKNALLTRLADQVIVHGNQQSEVLCNQYHLSEKMVNTIYLGAPEIFKTLSSHNGLPDPKSILFFGRIQKYKGIDILVKATPYILADVPNVRIVIAGMGESQSIQKAMMDYPDVFEIHNRFIKADEVAHFFQNSALVVLPYLDATQSGILPTAYMFKRAVVATRVGSIPEVVEHGKTGLLVNPGDEYALAEAVISLLLNPELCRLMGEAAAAKLDKDLSWQVLAEKTKNVYERAGKKKPAESVLRNWNRN